MDPITSDPQHNLTIPIHHQTVPQHDHNSTLPTNRNLHRALQLLLLLLFNHPLHEHRGPLRRTRNPNISRHATSQHQITTIQHQIRANDVVRRGAKRKLLLQLLRYDGIDPHAKRTMIFYFT